MRNLFVLFFILQISIVNAYAFEDSDVKASINKLGGIDKFIKALSDSMSKNLPSQLDADTKIIAVLSNGNTLNITHMIINTKTKNDIGDKKTIDSFIKFQTNKVCTSQVSKIAINEYGATYHYQYLSVTGENLFVFDVNKSKCVK